MNKSEIINLALQTAGDPPVSTDQQVQYQSAYKMVLDDLLSERRWLFSLQLLSTLPKTTDGTDLNYSYKYQLPSDAIGILDTSASKNQYLNSMSIADGLTVGYNLPPLSDRKAVNSVNFVFLDGVLHSDQEVTQVIYQRKVIPEVMTPEFRVLFIHKLAEFIAGNMRRNHDHAREIRSFFTKYTYTGYTKRNKINLLTHT